MTASTVNQRRMPARLGPWQPTIAHHRAVVVAAVAVIVALLVRRPDLLVIATPLAVVAAWSALARPATTPTFTDRIGNPVVREGDATTWHGSIAAADGLDLVAAALPGVAWLQRRPEAGSVVATGHDGAAEVSVVIRTTRWGRHVTAPGQVVLASCWAAFRCSARTTRHELGVLPLPAVFDTATAFRPSQGLVGVYRSNRPGEGTEFAGIRPFRFGDRLRRINWPTSQRTGELHVSSTWADQDVHVALLLDATDDIGLSEGIDGLASSLDTSVRAAGAIAQHYTRRGDRVSLRVLGGSPGLDVPPSTGRPHLRRILDRLTHVRPAERSWGVRLGLDLRRITVGGDVLVILLSPMVTPDVLDRAVSLGRHGVAVAVVDALPDHVVVDDDPNTAVAWRIRLLERRRELRAVAQTGIAVVPWRGPGSLDQFLREVSWRAHAPRMRSR